MNRPEKIIFRAPDRKRNPVAEQLRSALCRPQVIPSGKAYKRKPRNQTRYSD